jgi:type I restriction enzyme S subunit
LGFREAAARYIERLQQEGGKNVKAKKRQIAQHLTPFFNDRPLSHIDSSEVERFKKERRNERAALATINRELAVLSHLLGCALDWAWIKAAPVKIRRFQEANSRIVYLTKDQCAALEQAAGQDQNEDVHAFVMVGLRTGMRHSEILSIRKEHVDPDRLCDRLEAARTAREATRDGLTAASLARLKAPDPETFQDDARFALDALPALTMRPDQIKQLRQTILNLAMSGGFSGVERWPSSPVKLGDVASLQNGYAFKSEWFTKTGTRLLRNANVSHGVLNWAEEARLPDRMVTEYERFRLREGDVVLSLDRPFIVTGTKVARVQPGDLPALLLQRVGRFLLSEALDPEYLFIWINSPLFSDQIDPGRSNGVPHISSKQIEAAVLFVPPLAEQRRIVTKVDELMKLCDRLEASLTTGDATRRRLLDALLADALAPASEQAEAA